VFRTTSLRSLAFALFAAGAAGSLVACRQEPPNVTIHTTDKDVVHKGTMVVTGTATMQVSPDLADLIMTLEGKAMRPGAAAASVRKKQDQLVAALRALGIEDADLKLSTLSIQPVYEWIASSQVFKGYTARIVITATTRKFDQLGAMMEAGGEAGAVEMSSAFRRSDLDDLKKKVRELALLAARDKAKQSSTVLGLELGRISGIVEDGHSYMFTNYYFPQVANVMDSNGRSVPNIGAELQPLTLNVTLTYDLPDAA
jgi:uncharacterized protein YggE